MALDPNCCRKQTLWLHDLCLEVLTLHGHEFHLILLEMSRIWHSISAVYVQPLPSLAITLFGEEIERITSSMPSGCATCYVTVVCHIFLYSNYSIKYGLTSVGIQFLLFTLPFFISVPTRGKAASKIIVPNIWLWKKKTIKISNVNSTIFEIFYSNIISFF